MGNQDGFTKVTPEVDFDVPLRSYQIGSCRKQFEFFRHISDDRNDIWMAQWGT